MSPRRFIERRLGIVPRMRRARDRAPFPDARGRRLADSAAVILGSKAAASLSSQLPDALVRAEPHDSRRRKEQVPLDDQGQSRAVEQAIKTL